MTPQIELAGAAKLAHEVIRDQYQVHAAAADLWWLLAVAQKKRSKQLAEVELLAHHYHLAADWRTEQRHLLSANTENRWTPHI